MEAAKVNTGSFFEDFQGPSRAVVSQTKIGTTLEPDRNQPGNPGVSLDRSEGHPDSPSRNEAQPDFEDFFQGGNGAEDDRNQTGTRVEAALTLKEAVEFYKISEKTVRLHISLGKIPAQKITGPRGPEWRIYPGGIPAEVVEVEEHAPIAEDSDQGGTTIDVAAMQDGTTLEGEPTNDSTSVEPAWNQAAPGREQAEVLQTKAFSGEVERLLIIVQDQAHKLEAANFRLGYLEAQSENYKDQIKLLTDSQHKRGRWSHFCSWFIGAKG